MGTTNTGPTPSAAQAAADAEFVAGTAEFMASQSWRHVGAANQRLTSGDLVNHVAHWRWSFEERMLVVAFLLTPHRWHRKILQLSGWEQPIRPSA